MVERDKGLARSDRSSADEITVWLNRLSAGDDEAAGSIWNAYYAKLMVHAKRKLGKERLRTFDEEDVALSALHSFCRGQKEGRFPELHDRDGLWKLLLTITARKVFWQRRHARAKKRGGGHVRGESAFQTSDSHEDEAEGIVEVLGKEPSPDLACMFLEHTQLLLDGLEDEKLRQIAAWKLEGYNNSEIAGKLNCASRTIERKVNLLRKEWTRLGLVSEA